MGKTQYQRSLDFLKVIKNEYGVQLHFDFFLNQMRMIIGADETRTIKPYLRLMVDMNLIEQEGETVRIK